MKQKFYTLYINGKRVSNHAYPYITAVHVFSDRFFRALNSGLIPEIELRHRRTRKFQGQQTDR